MTDIKYVPQLCKKTRSIKYTTIISNNYVTPIQQTDHVHLKTSSFFFNKTGRKVFMFAPRINDNLRTQTVKSYFTRFQILYIILEKC